MNPLPTIISFYTKDSPYQYFAEALQKSCADLSLEIEIEPAVSAGSWEMNCAYKPLFILKMLQKLKRGILWVDSDAVFVRRPEVLKAFEADIAVRAYPECPLDHISKIGSGTFYANYTPASLELVRRWAELSLKELGRPDRREEFWDQVSLRDAIRLFDRPASIGLLPLEYMKIFDHPLHERECPNPVIVHNQASRLCKKWMG
jgi:hypothetical protein